MQILRIKRIDLGKNSFRFCWDWFLTWKYSHSRYLQCHYPFLIVDLLFELVIIYYQINILDSTKIPNNNDDLFPNKSPNKLRDLQVSNLLAGWTSSTTQWW